MDASQLIDDLVAELGDWRGDILAGVRRSILEADPEMVEEWKYRGTPVWSHAGHVCVATVCKDKIKVTFGNGAHIADPAGLFNNGLTGSKWRAIDYFKDAPIREAELGNLIRSAVEFNLAKPKTGARKSAK